MKIGVRLPAGFDSAGEFLADCQALEAAGADLLLLGEGGHDPWLLAAAAAAVTRRVSLAPPGSGPRLETLAALARGRLLEDLSGWAEVELPAGREEWRQLLAEQEASGSEGVIVAQDARLLDLLRNPDQVADRTDLQLAQG